MNNAVKEAKRLCKLNYPDAYDINLEAFNVAENGYMVTLSYSIMVGAVLTIKYVIHD
jgi:hypothetical protein